MPAYGYTPDDLRRWDATGIDPHAVKKCPKCQHIHHQAEAHTCPTADEQQARGALVSAAAEAQELGLVPEAAARPPVGYVYPRQQIIERMADDLQRRGLPPGYARD